MKSHYRLYMMLLYMEKHHITSYRKVHITSNFEVKPKKISLSTPYSKAASSHV